ncbi:PadR family transcriptional regulator [Brevibacterium sp. UCMA 11754]|uniref:PadR family transcriptional regulator n=1 Tax=Brevibacterium sp. UCMA 11754 TaxID=2749198 RepID=UPI001F265C97|nr:PadR family transcriptional regulator [Brevibacterium sp. UCMA 11754]MCF2571762.1 PadR family transcriptional regulator [Brevibacterium sp. UCMA 11754]
MNEPFNHGGFSRRNGDWGGANIWEAVEQLRSSFNPKQPFRMNRGDVRAGILTLLAEAPMHGYQIIQEIEERSGGSWKPSPGSVYPTLQLLTDEGLISSESSSGRKTYSLTEDGREQLASEPESNAPWESAKKPEAPRAANLAKAGVELAQAAAQVGRSGSKEQVAEAVTALEDTKRRLYSILAED